MTDGSGRLDKHATDQLRGEGPEPAHRAFPSLTTQAIALASGSLATQASALLLLMSLARLVPKTELGAYQQLGLVYGIVSPLLVAGIPAALLYFVPRSEDPGQRRRWTGGAYLLLGLIGAAVSVTVVVGRNAIAEGVGNPGLADALLVYAPYPFMAFVTAVMPTSLVAVGRAGLAAALNALTGGLAAVSVLAAVAVEADASHMAAGLVVGQSVAAFASVYAVRRAVGISFRGAGVSRAGRALLRYGLPLALTGLAGKLAFQFDRLVVSHNFSPAVYAVYVVGAVELPITVIVQQSVNAVLVPALARLYAVGDLTAMVALWHRAIRRTSLVLFPVFVFFLATATETIVLLFGEDYRESADVFRVYLLLVPLRVATYGLVTQAIGRTQINLSASLVLLVVNACLVLSLVGPLGLIGPALGTVVATYVVAVYYLIRLRAILRVPIHSLLPWPMLMVHLAITALASLPLWLLLTLTDLGPLVSLATAALVFAPCYVALMLLTGRLAPQEIVWLRRVVGLAAVPPWRRRDARRTNDLT